MSNIVMSDLTVGGYVRLIKKSTLYEEMIKDDTEENVLSAMLEKCCDMFGKYSECDMIQQLKIHDFLTLRPDYCVSDLLRKKVLSLLNILHFVRNYYMDQVSYYLCSHPCSCLCLHGRQFIEYYTFYNYFSVFRSEKIVRSLFITDRQQRHRYWYYECEPSMCYNFYVFIKDNFEILHEEKKEILALMRELKIIFTEFSIVTDN